VATIRPQSRLSFDGEHGITCAGQNHDECQDSSTAIADLIGHGEHDARENHVEQRSRVSIRELKKADNQGREAGYRYYVEKSRHY
jgi:hypothetical protein